MLKKLITRSSAGQMNGGDGIPETLVSGFSTYFMKKMSERLSKMIENFLPVQQEVHQWRIALLQSSVFSSDDDICPCRYLCEQKEVLTLGLYCRYGIAWRKHSAVIPTEEMHRFKFMLDYSDEAINMSIAPLSPGAKIQAIKGPLSDLVRTVTVNGKSKVAVRFIHVGMCFCRYTSRCEFLRNKGLGP